ncbi:MAG: hypothetical protein HC836_47270 [Richelia sp. RM2_1_2]|nr:hypothetical protein [Richelia sp. RM2_1_2]
MNVIQCTCLGKMGRFGNCLFQYAFARAYAEKYGAVLEVPEWIGEKLFGLKDKRPSLKLPKTNIDQVPWGKVNIDLCGHFQHKQFLDILNRNSLKMV